MILFNDFKAHVAALRPELDAAVARVMDSGWFILGRELEAFEQELAAWLGAPLPAVGVGNGTEAIALALNALGVGPGDEVITANLTAYPTITGIRQAGATPVVADIVPETGLLDPALLPAKLTPRTRAVMPVHLYGQACDMDAILAVARRAGVFVVEDCAQAIGARWRGRACGTIGDAGCYSFYPTKNLGALGDAGAVTAADLQVREKLTRLRNYGQRVRYYHDENGINSRLDEMQAAILRAKLPHLTAWNARRQEIAARYRAELRNVEYLQSRPEAAHVYHLFVVKVPRREAFMKAMQERGVQTLIHYPVPINRQLDFPGQKDEAFPATEALAAQVVSLPIYPELTDAQVAAVINATNAVCR